MVVVVTANMPPTCKHRLDGMPKEADLYSYISYNVSFLKKNLEGFI